MAEKINKPNQQQLAELYLKEVTAWVQRYTYHTHWTRLEGYVLAHFAKNGDRVYYFSANERYGEGSIKAIQEGWNLV